MDLQGAKIDLFRDFNAPLDYKILSQDESGIFQPQSIYIYIFYIVDRKEEWKGYTSPPCRFVVRHTPSASYIQCHD